MRCEIAGCEEIARFRIDGVGCACKECMLEVCEDMQIDEEEGVKRI